MANGPWQLFNNRNRYTCVSVGVISREWFAQVLLMEFSPYIEQCKIQDIRNAPKSAPPYYFVNEQKTSRTILKKCKIFSIENYAEVENL